jgi:hypothetical protein
MNKIAIKKIVPLSFLLLITSVGFVSCSNDSDDPVAEVEEEGEESITELLTDFFIFMFLFS